VLALLFTADFHYKLTCIEVREYGMFHIKANKYTVKFKLKEKPLEEINHETIQAGFSNERIPIGKRVVDYFTQCVEKQLADFYGDSNLFKVAMVTFLYKN